MSEQIRARGEHALLAVLLATGVVAPLLGLLEASFLSPALILPLLATVLVFEFACLNRRCAIGSFALGSVLLLAWLFAGDGQLAVRDVAIAIGLRFSGASSALPLVKETAVPLLTVLVTLLCCLAGLKSVSCFPAACLCVGVSLLLYLTNTPAFIPWLLPALAAMLLKLMTDRFPETKTLHLFPWIAIITGISFLLAGSGIVVPELQEKAEAFRQAVMDRLFFTEPRDVFSLSTVGYYPQGLEQLGGKPNPDDQPVMQVSTPKTAYLRGVILNDYNGRTWHNTTGGRRYLWQSLRFANQRNALFDGGLPEETVRNALCTPLQLSVRLLRDSASTLFVPQRIRELNPGGGLVPYFSNASEVFATRNLAAGDTYSVSAPLFVAGDPGLGSLIEICATLEDGGYDRAVETFTSLPSHLEQPLYELAREVSSVAQAPYEKALALQTWLSRSFRYALEVEDQPPEIDFVTHFLLDTKEGYCTYFASAMTVLCRMIGLPARYVEGYLAEPNAQGEALVTGLNAHAWTEVYFRGFGWLTFDATPRTRAGDGTEGSGGLTGPDTPESAETPTPEPPDESSDAGPEETPDPRNPSAQDHTASAETPASETPSPESAATPEPEGSDPEASSEPNRDSSSDDGNPDSSESPSFPWIWLVAGVILLLLALRILFTSPTFRVRRAKTADDRLDCWAAEIERLLRAEGITRRQDESPMAFGRRVDASGRFNISLGAAGECMSLVHYSRAHAQEGDIQLMQDTAVLLKSELSRPARLRCFLLRLLPNQKSR